MKMVKDMESDEKNTSSRAIEEQQDEDENAIFNFSSSLSNSEFDLV